MQTSFLASMGIAVKASANTNANGTTAEGTMKVKEGKEIGYGGKHWENKWPIHPFTKINIKQKIRNDHMSLKLKTIRR